MVGNPLQIQKIGFAKKDFPCFKEEDVNSNK
jgi:hypothetical protein